MKVKLLVAYEKHSTRFFAYETQEDLKAICLKLLTDRVNYGWIDEDEGEEEYPIRAILEEKDAKAAKEIIWERMDLEYEGFEITYTEGYI